MRVGGSWRSRYPLRFFLWGLAVSIVLFAVGIALFTAANNKVPPAEPEDDIGNLLAYLGLLLAITLIVLGIKDAAVHVARSLRKPGRVRPVWSPKAHATVPTVNHSRPARAAKPPRANDIRVGLNRRIGLLITALVAMLSKFHGKLLEGNKRGHQKANSVASGDRRVTILMLGFSGSGKTLMLASLYHYFAHGGPAGIRFITDNASNGVLVRLAAQIRDTPGGYFPAGTRAAETRQWSFKVRVESGAQEANAFTLAYLDYAGRYVESLLGPGADDPPDEKFERAVADADVLMGVIDGEQLRRLMAEGYNPGIVGSIERLLNILVRARQRNIHLVISKWDLMRGPGGAYYTIADVINVLDRISDAFRYFRQNPRLGKLRIIPVSALGVNGFVSPGKMADGAMTRTPGVPWRPWNIQVPFFCAIPDIIRYDLARIDGRSADARGAGRQGYASVAKITLAVLSLVGMATFNVYGVTVTLPVNEIIKRIKKFLESRHERGKVPSRLDENEAIGYVLNECYSSVEEFEQQWPDSRLDARVSSERY